MRSLILQKVAQGVLPISTLFALYLLLSGHDSPGGGFIAGLVTAGAFILQAVAFGRGRLAPRLVRATRHAVGAGLLLALLAGTLALFAGDPFFTHYHADVTLPGDIPVPATTTFVFDAGVYLVVIGTAAATLAMFMDVPT